MKRLVKGAGLACYIACWLAATGAAGAGAPVIPDGETYEAVTNRLGEPTGRLKRGEWEILYYDQGAVRLHNGRVKGAKLQSEEEVRAERARRDAAEAARAAQQATARATRIADGTTEKTRVLADPTFTNQAAAVQVDYWEKFQRSYPEVDVSAELNAARTAAQAARQAAAQVQTATRVSELQAELAAKSNAYTSAGKNERRRLRREMSDLEARIQAAQSGKP